MGKREEGREEGRVGKREEGGIRVMGGKRAENKEVGGWRSAKLQGRVGKAQSIT